MGLCIQNRVQGFLYRKVYEGYGLYCKNHLRRNEPGLCNPSEGVSLQIQGLLMFLMKQAFQRCSANLQNPAVLQKGHSGVCPWLQALPKAD